MIIERVFTVGLEIAVGSQEGQLVPTVVVTVVLHQDQNIAGTPAEKRTVSEEGFEILQHLGEAAVTRFELIHIDMGQLGHMAVELLGNLRGHQYRKIIDHIQLFIQFYSAELDDLIEESVILLAVGAVEFKIQYDVGYIIEDDAGGASPSPTILNWSYLYQREP